MPATLDTLSALSALEREFDGPIPELLRQIARCGSAAAVELVRAKASREFYRAELKQQFRAIRNRRADEQIAELNRLRGLMTEAATAHNVAARKFSQTVALGIDSLIEEATRGDVAAGER